SIVLLRRSAHRPLLLFYFSLLPLPITSTLFPYTTLFRSLHKNLQSGVFSHFHRWENCIADNIQRINVRYIFFSKSRYIDLRIAQDRKSTRLNSSHVSISYAVFCLKKKNK